MHDDHDRDHDHGSEMSPIVAEVPTFHTVPTGTGYVAPLALDLIVETYETKIEPRHGHEVVARAWRDPAHKARLMKDAMAPIAELDFTGVQGEYMVAVENTDAMHNLVICTLCSCYPLPVLGLPPVWHKSVPDRSRAVLDPRSVHSKLGLNIPASKEIRVWNSTAEIRYLVIPPLPAGREGWAVEGLAGIGYLRQQIGAGLALDPQTRGASS